jgi:hypothetical protein
MLGSGSGCDLGPVCRGDRSPGMLTVQRRRPFPFGVATGPPWVTDRSTATTSRPCTARPRRVLSRHRAPERLLPLCRSGAQHQDQHRFQDSLDISITRSRSHISAITPRSGRDLAYPPSKNRQTGGRRGRKAPKFLVERVIGFRSIACDRH